MSLCTERISVRLKNVLLPFRDLYTSCSTVTEGTASIEQHNEHKVKYKQDTVFKRPVDYRCSKRRKSCKIHGLNLLITFHEVDKKQLMLLWDCYNCTRSPSGCCLCITAEELVFSHFTVTSSLIQDTELLQNRNQVQSRTDSGVATLMDNSYFSSKPWLAASYRFGT